MPALVETPRPTGGGQVARQWVLWLAVPTALTVGMLAVRHRLDKAHVALAYLLTVLGASAAAGRAIGLTVAGLAFLAFNFLFLPPYYTLVIADPLDWLVLLAFLVTSIVAAQLLYRATATADAALQRAAELDRLATLGAETLSAPGAVEALQAIVAVIRTTVGVDTCGVYRRSADGRLVRPAYAARGGDDDASAAVPAQAEGLLVWATENGRSAAELSDGTVRLPGGSGTAATAAGVDFVVREPGRIRGRLRSPGRRAHADSRARGGDGDADASDEVRALVLPLVVREQTVGVLRIASSAGVSLSSEQARLLMALAYYAALGLERVRLVETAERAEAERRVESLRSALLMSVSHDLRTPLTTIKGIAHEVAEGADRARAVVIESEADRLNALVGDLLDLSRIHAGAVRPNVAVNTVDELVGAALQRAAGALGSRPVAAELPPDDVLAGRFDFTEALRALVNLLENAAKYAPPDTPLEVRARRDGERLVITVLDRGPGVPTSERERIFEPFYRPPGTPPDVRGTGLGLSIARGLAEAQGGTVRYEPRPGGGSAFVLELPAADAPADEVLADEVLATGA
jgi:two-component system sensor histidine kinase KdpD